MLRNKTGFITLLLVALLLTLLTSCHKYPKDPFLSLKRPEKRILGRYKLIHYYVNGVDSVGNSRYHFYSSDNHIIFHANISIAYHTDNGPYIGDRTGVADFRKYKKALYITISDEFPQNIVNIFVIFRSTWDILKLYNNELWLKSTINGSTYEIHLKK